MTSDSKHNGFSQRKLIAVLCGVVFLAIACEDQPAPAETAVQAPIAIKTHTVTSGPLTVWQYAEGVAQAKQKEFLQFELPGSVTFIGNDENGLPLREGSRVVGPTREDRFGQLIARLDRRDNNARVAQADAEVVAALGRVEAAEAALTQASSEFDRQQELREQGVSVAAEYEAAEAQYRAADAQLNEARASVRSVAAIAEEAKLGLERTSLFAPFDGVISLMNVREGDFSPGPAPDPRDAMKEANAAVVVINDTEFEIALQIPPYEADLFAEGQRVLVAPRSDLIASSVQTGTLDGVLAGTVWSVSPSVSLQNRTILVKLRVEGEKGVLRDGTYVSAWVATADLENTLQVPYKAITTSGLNSSVFVVDTETQTVERRSVELGLLGIDQAQVLSGLSLDDVIVSEGQHLLSDGASVRIIEPTRLTPDAGGDQ